jgi:hypothetical protein
MAGHSGPQLERARSGRKRDCLAFSAAPPTGGQIEKWPPVAGSREKVQVLGFGSSYGPQWWEASFSTRRPTLMLRNTSEHGFANSFIWSNCWSHNDDHQLCISAFSSFIFHSFRGFPSVGNVRHFADVSVNPIEKRGLLFASVPSLVSTGLQLKDDELIISSPKIFDQPLLNAIR